jgi:hypothetical protein
VEGEEAVAVMLAVEQLLDHLGVCCHVYVLLEEGLPLCLVIC